MRVLLDHNVPRQLRTKMGRHLVLTARQRGWDRLSNGDLLRAAELDTFEVFVTTDNDFFRHEGDPQRAIGIVFLTTNHWPSLRLAHQSIQTAVEASAKGTFLVVAVDFVRPASDAP